MPIYKYACEACGHQLEALQKMSDEPLSECPECHQAALKKQLTTAGFGSKAASIDNAPACATGGCGASCMSDS